MGTVHVDSNVKLILSGAAPTTTNLLPGEIAFGMIGGNIRLFGNPGGAGAGSIVDLTSSAGPPYHIVDDTTGTLTIPRGGTGLTASPSLLIDLAVTTAANVFQASPRPGVTGTLGIANGGTGQTTLAGARTWLGINANPGPSLLFPTAQTNPGFVMTLPTTGFAGGGTHSTVAQVVIAGLLALGNV